MQSHRRITHRKIYYINQVLALYSHINVLLFQKPKLFVCQQKQQNNCQVCNLSPLLISASGQRQSKLEQIETWKMLG